MSRLLPKIVPLSLPEVGELSIKAFPVRTLLSPAFKRAKEHYSTVIEPGEMTFVQAVLSLYQALPSEVHKLVEAACGKEPGWASSLPPMFLIPIAQAIHEAHVPEKPPAEPIEAPSGRLPTLEELVARLVVEAHIPFETVLDMTYAMVAAFIDALVASQARRDAQLTVNAAAATSSEAYERRIASLATIADNGAL